jgi:hypothetical protein
MKQSAAERHSALDRLCSDLGKRACGRKGKIGWRLRRHEINGGDESVSKEQHGAMEAAAGDALAVVDRAAGDVLAGVGERGPGERERSASPADRGPDDALA